MKGRRNRDKVRRMSVKEARHNLEVTLKRTKEECFRAAKECGSESLEGFKKMDAFVRSQYYDEPQKMAEWDEIARKYGFLGVKNEDEADRTTRLIKAIDAVIDAHGGWPRDAK